MRTGRVPGEMTAGPAAGGAATAGHRPGAGHGRLRGSAALAALTLVMALLPAVISAATTTTNPSLIDIDPGSNSSSPGSLTNVEGTLFFRAFDGTTGGELWRSDGTAAGTWLVKDINPGSATSFPDSLANVNGTLYFSASDGTNGAELWRSDGTAAGTSLVKDIKPGAGHSSPTSLTDVNGTLFFRANDGTNGVELWKSDGTEAGTSLVKDINPGSSGSSPYSLVNVNGTLYFAAWDGATGDELWRSDGTAAGTSLVKDIMPGAFGSFISSLANVDGTLFFRANDGPNGTELWRSDGTAAGTSLVKDINPGVGGSSPSLLVNVSGTLFFLASDDGTNGKELWKSDGTNAGTSLVKDVNPGSSVSPHSLLNVDGTLFFTADDGTNGEELWKSDGTEAGTSLAKDINPGAGSSSPFFPTNVDGLLFFKADDGTNGQELWVYAGLPGKSTGVSATAGNGQVSVSWTAPSSNGGAAITSYTVTGSPGGTTATTGNGSTTSATVTGLTNGTAYTFTVTSTNSAGTSVASDASSAVTPVAPASSAPAPSPTEPSTPDEDETAEGQGSATTDVDGDGADVNDPVETTVKAPSGTVTISETETTGTEAPSRQGYRILGANVTVTAPSSDDPDAPLELSFELHSSLLAGSADTVRVFRNDELVERCTSAGSLGPDPCVSIRTRAADDDVVITVLSSAASVWNFAVPAVACPGSEATSAGFDDVAASSPHAGGIDCLTWWGVIEGTTETTFDPAGTLARGQLALMLARAIDAVTPGLLPDDAPDAFDDDGGTIHESALDRLAALGIYTGTVDRASRSSQATSRGQVASLLVRTIETVTGTALDVAPDTFGDDDGTTHETAIDQLATLEVISGRTPTHYAPNEPLRRSQLATLLTRTLDLLLASDTTTPQPQQ